ncbi:hypothetical protein WICPIJ_005994 [Wickerhamomyces pijperi]|uniref:Uncharacterized protein n=1 Tax=Wickerhamomyces pijperi TaxID=599730 RepID=A0A9P8Q4K0_WICPI|nr:hypothetical protein WICPIJ_005994 [Wickerhamomyces pijperi]
MNSFNLSDLSSMEPNPGTLATNTSHPLDLSSSSIPYQYSSETDPFCESSKDTKSSGLTSPLIRRKIRSKDGKTMIRSNPERP